MTRDDLINNFLRTSGLKDCERIKIPGDASFRRYERIISGGREYILMDSPPDTEDVKPFIKVGGILLNLNLSSPKIFYRDIDNGFLLLEDFGDNKFNNIFKKNPERQEELYKLAVNVLADIYNDRKTFDIPEYSKEKLISEAMLMPEWYLPLFGKFDEEKLNEVKTEYKNIISRTIDKLQLPNDVMVLRDYHADNLMLLEDRTEAQKVGLLDFQDALMGNAAYDLVSLLEDARRDVPSHIQEKMIKYFLQDTGYTIPPSKFINDYHILGAQRNLKIIGIFSRLKVRDGKEIYLPLIPRVKEYLKKDLRHESLNELREFLNGINVI